MRGGIGASYLTDINLKYTYLKANLLYRYYIIPKKKQAIFVDAGFSLGYAFSSKGEIKNLTNGVIFKDYKNAFNTDGSFIIGAGAYMKRVLAAIRYERGNQLYLNNVVSPKVKMLFFLVGYRLF